MVIFQFARFFNVYQAGFFGVEIIPRWVAKQQPKSKKLVPGQAPRMRKEEFPAKNKRVSPKMFCCFVF